MFREIDQRLLKPAVTLTTAGLAMTLSNPFDLIRIRMQTTPELVEQGILKKSYAGIADCVRRVRTEEGLKAFWKGNSANLLRFYGSETINFLFKEFIQKKIFLGNLKGKKNHFGMNFISGALGSWMSLLVLYPFEHARNQISTTINGKSKTIVGSIQETVRKSGFRALYTGSSISLYGVAVFRGTYFGIFDTFKGEKTGLERWSIAYFSSLMAIILTYPTDTIRRRLMCSQKRKKKYSGFTDCSLKMYKKQGLKSFYRGSPIILFQSLTSSCVLFLYDMISRDLQNRKI